MQGIIIIVTQHSNIVILEAIIASSTLSTLNITLKFAESLIRKKLSSWKKLVSYKHDVVHICSKIVRVLSVILDIPL